MVTLCFDRDVGGFRAGVFLGDVKLGDEVGDTGGIRVVGDRDP